MILAEDIPAQYGPDCRPYEPHGGAREMWRCRAPRVAYVGPSDTGKTRADLEKAYWVANEYPGCRQLFVRQVKATLSQTVLVTFENKVVPAGDPILKGPSREHRSSYKFGNGSEIVLSGLDEPTKTRSGEYDRVYVFEASETDQGDVEELYRCLRYGMTPYHQLVLETNPSTPSHWIKGLIDSEAYSLINARHLDNPSITPERLDTLQRMTGHRRARLYLGQWAGADGMVYDGWDRALHVREHPGPFKFIIGGIDDGFGEGHPFVALRIGIDGDFKAHVMAERRGTNMQVTRRTEVARELLSDAQSVSVDPSAPDVIEAFRGANLSVRKAINDVLPGINRVADRLLVRGDGKPRVTIDPSCKELIREMESYEWEPNRVKDTPKKKHDHGPDALRYAMMTLDRMGGSAVLGHEAEKLAEQVEADLRAERAKKYGPGILGEFERMRAEDPDWGFSE